MKNKKIYTIMVKYQLYHLEKEILILCYYMETDLYTTSNLKFKIRTLKIGGPERAGCPRMLWAGPVYRPSSQISILKTCIYPISYTNLVSCPLQYETSPVTRG